MRTSIARHITLLVSAALAMAVTLTPADALADAPKKGAPTAQVLAKESAPAKPKANVKMTAKVATAKPKAKMTAKVPMKKAKAKVAPKPVTPKPASTPAPAPHAPRTGRA